MRDALKDCSVPLRPPEGVLVADRLGAYAPSPLSFMRQMTRRAAHEAWTFSINTWDVDAIGVGHAVLQVDCGKRTYALVCFFHDLPDDMRSDRVIAQAWDATFTLFDGVPDASDVDRLERAVPLQEAGRLSSNELTLSRANRSGRLWDYVVECLASGRQPEPARLGEVGYLMRTTAVYGSGKFGAADRSKIEDRAECQAPFQVEMITVYLIRWAVILLVNHLARSRGGDRSVVLDDALAQGLGIGNSTGLGMAPFLINHPVLWHRWIMARETALARARAQATCAEDGFGILQTLVDATRQRLGSWCSKDSVQAARDRALRDDLGRLGHHLTSGPHGSAPFDALWLWAQNACGSEAQEWLASALIELIADDLDDLAAQMHVPLGRDGPMDGRRTIGDLRRAIAAHYMWALHIDWADPAQQDMVWYTSEEKLEPRLGARSDEAALEDYALPLAPARDVALLWAATNGWDEARPVAALAMAHPNLRHAIKRVQTIESAPYGELRFNTIARGIRPVDMLRAKLAFFGASRFDPRSDLWLRVSLFAGAPLPVALSAQSEQLWPYWLAPWET